MPKARSKILSQALLVLGMVILFSGCMAGKPQIKLLNGGPKNNNKALPPPTAKYGFSAGSGVATTGTYNVAFSVNFTSAPLPATTGTKNVRAVDPEVMHHAH